ncbi:ubiquitin-associated protein 1-like [Cyprinodon tularosa]|uniref:ubiquitin-associated protein 1-like n=1 Tax=Cyprinodon tularosa TaxID=77115 RepID=UPI0018E2766F|nr:ubiquitin-associated protein 1-like [Cyprinodon tularosa]XP_038160381.1 ubiquitin-associated protein 1-like [Cyprinodon tularosa]XP_038160382.1 ubiquitin-associated protein 1-like [Cyprinodon tularosa]
MDGVPLKMPQAAGCQTVRDDVKVTLPNYLTILRETEFEFSLENWVLTGLQNSPTNQQRPQPFSPSSEPSASCPPYWMMFSSPQQSRLASRHSSDFWEPNPRPRSHSLTLSVLRTTFAISDSEDEGENTAKKAEKGQTAETGLKEERPAVSCQSGQRKAQRAFVPDLLNPPSCLSSLPHKRRKNLRQCSFSGMDTSNKTQSNTDSRSLSPSSFKAPNDSADTIRKTTGHQKTAEKMVLSPNSCRTYHQASLNGGLSSALDSSVELLSALSPEERELLGVITARGYPLRTAIIALQRTGQQTPDQILSYLIACEHLCQQGYDKAQVEEALEMFQNCEAKAEEFLHLLNQFNEMGFHPNTIKEVLLVHENHRERALEELMMRVA